MNQIIFILIRLTLDKPKLRCVVSDGDSTDTKLLLLREGLGKKGKSQQSVMMQCSCYHFRGWSSNEAAIIILHPDDVATEISGRCIIVYSMEGMSGSQLIFPRLAV